MNIMIDFEKITKIYRGKRLAIKDLSTRIDDGKISAFIGKNGSGKTTSIKCLLGLCHPSGGRVLINDVKANAFFRLQPQAVGYLSEKVFLPANVCANEIIMTIGQCRGISRFDCEKQMNRLAEYFFLDLSHKLKTSQNSNGMSQKIGLILALIHKPSLIVLDEPTNALDPVAKNSLFCLLKSKKNEGCTILLATHHLDELESLADEIFVFDRNTFIAKQTLNNMCQVNGAIQIHLLNMANDAVIGQLCAENRLISFVTPDSVLVNCAFDNDIATAIQQISKAGLLIKSINRQQRSLERSYLELIKQRAESDGL